MSFLTLIAIIGSPFLFQNLAVKFGDKLFTPSDDTSFARKMIDNCISACSDPNNEWLRPKFGFIFGLGVSIGILVKKLID